MDNTIIDNNNRIEPNGHEQEGANQRSKDNTEATEVGGKKPGTDQKTEVKKDKNIMDED